jgi:hypothetical protein
MINIPETPFIAIAISTMRLRHGSLCSSKRWSTADRELSTSKRCWRRTDTPISGYDSRSPWKDTRADSEIPRADPLRAMYGNEGGRQGSSNQAVSSSSSSHAHGQGLNRLDDKLLTSVCARLRLRACGNSAADYILSKANLSTSISRFEPKPLTRQ